MLCASEGSKAARSLGSQGRVQAHRQKRKAWQYPSGALKLGAVSGEDKDTAGNRKSASAAGQHFATARNQCKTQDVSAERPERPNKRSAKGCP